MARWTPSIGYYMWSRYAAVTALGFILLIFTDYSEFGVSEIIASGLIMAFLAVGAYLVINWWLSDVYHHEASAWRMDEDKVLRLLAQAMVARGARPPMERRGKRVWFLLPPLSIVVRGRLLSTQIYVGPWSEEHEMLVKRLEGFVEQALA